MINKMRGIYETAPSVDEWLNNNTPDDTLTYGSGQHEQAGKMSAIANLLDLDSPRIVSYHHSKSVILPVPAYYFNPAIDLCVFVVLRDNFYDLNCTILSSINMEVDMHDIYQSTTRDWLESEKQKALNYLSSESYNIIASSEDDDWDWFDKYWSSTKIIRSGGNYFKAPRAFLQGIDKLKIPNNLYLCPTNNFTFVPQSYAHFARVLEKATTSAVRAFCACTGEKQ